MRFENSAKQFVNHATIDKVDKLATGGHFSIYGQRVYESFAMEI